MHIKDIPKLTNISNNKESIALSRLPGRLADWDKDYGIDLDPEFQRGHVWKMEHKSKYIEFLLRGGVSPIIMFNSPAYNNFVKSDLPDTIVLVDGKQRITAILEFLDNKVPIFGGHYCKDIEGIIPLLRTKYITVCVNDLTEMPAILQWYLEMNEGNIAHSDDEIERVRNLLKSYKN